MQAVFRISGSSNSSHGKEADPKAICLDSEDIEKDNVKGLVNDSAVDLSEGLAFDMFGVSPSSENEVWL